MRWLAIILLLPGTGWACGEVDAIGLAPRDGGDPAIFARLDPPPVARPFDMILTFCEPPAGPVLVDAVMPAHQHGMNYTPEVTRLPDGRFQATGLVFHMPGLWQVQVTVQDAEGPRRHDFEMTVK